MHKIELTSPLLACPSIKYLNVHVRYFLTQRDEEHSLETLKFFSFRYGRMDTAICFNKYNINCNCLCLWELKFGIGKCSTCWKECFSLARLNLIRQSCIVLRETFVQLGKSFRGGATTPLGLRVR